MSNSDTVHETIVIERDFSCSVEALYNAFVDPVARARWGLPSSTAVIIYDETDFRVGGFDRSRCGSKDDPRYFVDAVYLDIQTNARIVYSERVADRDLPLSCALHTLEFNHNANKAQLKATIQIASFSGADMAQGVREGFAAAMDNLAQELHRPEV